ncbi:MAG TPA: N-acetylmuramoyl-L-alanine amidase [Kaistiaceae bacterium]|nr:N-acetylmuramoyl-L-alanine amidase [Kaistiaceae bacterium]
MSARSPTCAPSGTERRTTGRHAIAGRLSRALAACALAALVAAFPDVPVLANGCGPAVTLDIGHSPGRHGATSARGKAEYRFNRRFAQELAKVLEAGGIGPVRILNAAGADLTLKERAAEIRTLGEGILLSIHHDSVQPQYLSRWSDRGTERPYSDLFRGYSLFVSNRGGAYGRSVDLARTIGRSLQADGFRASLHHAEAIPGENRPIVDAENGVFRHDGLAVLKNAPVPAVLVEVGVILNRAEETDLEDAGYRARFQAAIAAAVATFCAAAEPAK